MHNRHVIPNYGERYHHGEAIATGFVESTVNEVVSKRFCKKQQMQWSKEGAHLLLQTRVRTLNGELGAIFKRWYPDMGSVSKVEMTMFTLPVQRHSGSQTANDDVVHRRRFRKADGLADQAFNACA